MTLLRGVDRSAFVAAFGQRLRDAGVPVDLGALAAFAGALEESPPVDLPRLYWLARVTLVRQPHDLERFEAVFDAVFRDAVLPVDPQARRTAQPPPGSADDRLTPVNARLAAGTEDAGLPWHTLPRAAESSEDDAGSRVLPELLPSAVERFADTPFEELDEEQMALLAGWLERATQRWPMRRSRRMRVHPAGPRVALRETIARSRRTGYEPLELARHRASERPRPVVMVGDVSQSMQSYSTAYLHLMRALARSGRAETFAFSTSLTRLTPALAHRSARVAIKQATEQVVDRYGGTHLARSLRTLLTSRHGNDLRGGVLVVASDGWDSDEPAELAEVMVRLRRRAHRVVWLNPRAASPGFAPLVGSMAAALPYCDCFLPAHTARAMTEVLDAISGVDAASSRA